ncbi:MAG: hypothetical protein PHX78_05050 [bacterium]|nr:hypothetical protein [bacterium]
MANKNETKNEKLARLEKDLKEVKGTLPEHCYGKNGYIDYHNAPVSLWQKIEGLEEEIKVLKKELGIKD